ncbi:Alpha/Beta hydrolase protein [Aspergillus crustosus]
MGLWEPSDWDEDCFQCNIWVPLGEPPENGWPVLFFIHGGFLQFGTLNIFSAAALLGETDFNAIVIMPAYRLGVFGFLNVSDLERDAVSAGDSSVGNHGFWDQRMALEWMRAHIADPSSPSGCRAYLVPGGVERLVLEWKVTYGKWFDKRNGVYDESAEEEHVHADFLALLRKAGSSEYKQSMKPTGLSHNEYYNLLVNLAPYESDGPNDMEEWNLFDTYLDSTVKALDNPHDLSTMLQRWHDDVTLISKEEDELDERGRAAKARLGEKAIRALKRLSIIPMPQLAT